MFDVETVSAITLSKSKQPEVIAFREKIEKDTEFLNVLGDVKIAWRLYVLRNGITEIPRCECCDNYCVFDKENCNKGFTSFCSPKCSREAGRLFPEIREKLRDRNFLYHHRIELRKSHRQIASELGCTDFAVIRWCKCLGIPDIDLKLVDPMIRDKIENKEWLYEEHVVKGRKLEDIGDELGVAKATVSVKLKAVGVKANNPNSYDRSFDKNSKECQEVVGFIRSIYDGEIVTNNRSILGGMELDIVLPELKVAFEYNGVFFHCEQEDEDSFAKRKGKEYHVGKTDLAAQKGYRLMHIWSSSWDLKKDIVKSMISHILKKTKNKIYARKCVIRKLDVYEARNFLDENHIQGYSNCTTKIGLFHENVLVSVMTFGKPRWNKTEQHELIRFANLKNTSVVGAFSRLLSFFRAENQGSIVSYADRTWSQGSVYLNNGFELTKINGPTYWYTRSKDNWVLLHKMAFRGRDGFINEKEKMKDLGYKRIWDCGSLTMVLK